MGYSNAYPNTSIDSFRTYLNEVLLKSVNLVVEIYGLASALAHSPHMLCSPQ